jgi:hypothetical protein
VCPINYGPGVGDNEVNICRALPCTDRTPNTNTLCLVFEDVDGGVECLRINESVCNTQCATNYDPLPSDEGGICTIAECENRIPINGSCVMTGDSIASRCYSLNELNKCYSLCPEHTTPNSSLITNPKCDVTACEGRVPTTRGVCSLTWNEACYMYGAKCYSVCPSLTTPVVDENV